MKTFEDLYKTLGAMDSRGDWSDNKQEVFLRDGVYDATNTPFLFTKGDEARDTMDEETLMFLATHGLAQIRVGSAYETYGIILFAGNPPKFKGMKGTVGRGACAVIENCPKTLVILAEND